MSNNKQTAVEWLVDKLSNYDSKMIELFDKEIEQAKEIEECQTIDFARHCLDKALDLDIRTSYINVEQYYNKTFGGNNE
jgi:hypothetical protein